MSEKVIYLRIDEDTHSDVRMVAAFHRETMSTWLRNVVQQAVNREVETVGKHLLARANGRTTASSSHSTV